MIKRNNSSLGSVLNLENTKPVNNCSVSKD